MHLYVLLACVPWGLVGQPNPMKITGVSLYDNHTAVCAEIRHDLSADSTTHNGYFKSPQNTSKESCYGEFVTNFISTLKNLTEKHKNDHLEKVYKNVRELKRICTKLQLAQSPVRPYVPILGSNGTCSHPADSFPKALGSTITKWAPARPLRGMERAR